MRKYLYPLKRGEIIMKDPLEIERHHFSTIDDDRRAIVILTLYSGILPANMHLNS